MGLNLPDPDTARLPRSPLELVICQVRFAQQAGAADANLALAFHERLGGSSGSYPQLAGIEGQELVVSGGPGGLQQAENRASAGWRFSSEAGDWVVSLMPDHVSLETTSYTTWKDDFQPRLREVIETAAATLEPVIEQRLGLRYVDRIEELKLSSIAEWRAYIAPELLGPIMHPSLGPEITAIGQQFQLRVDEQLRAAVRHGPVSDGESGNVDYLLDYDVFRQGGRPFDVAGLIGATDQLNLCAHQLFRASVTDDLFEFLGKS